MNDESCSNVILRKILQKINKETLAIIFRSLEKTTITSSRDQ